MDLARDAALELVGGIECGRSLDVGCLLTLGPES
jgi:hypothetical protein